MTDMYERLLEVAYEANPSDTYDKKEVEKITTKVWNFFNSLTEESKRKAALNIALFIYIHDSYSDVKTRGIPYKGKSNKEESGLVSVDFDFKNLPPLLGRIIFAYINECALNIL